MTFRSARPASVAAVLSIALGSAAFAQEPDASPPSDASAAPDAVGDAVPPAEPDAAPVEPPTAMLGNEETHALSNTVNLLVTPPFAWTGGEAPELDIPDLAQVPGAKTVIQRSWSQGTKTSEMFLVCATGPASDWAPGMESLLMERLNAIANTELAKRMTVSTFSPGQLEETAPIFVQPFEAQGKAGGDRKEGAVRVLEVDPLDNKRADVAANGRHTLAFLDDPARVLVCSAACVEPVGGRGVCPQSIASIHLQGQLAEEPLPTITGRLILGIKRRPAALLGTALGLMLALVGVLAILRGLLIRPSSA